MSRNVALHAIAVVNAVLREHIEKRRRSPHWSAVRREHLRLHGSCAACGGTSLLQVHHLQPFHEKPELELTPSNLLTLCALKLCHLDIGHGGAYAYFNPHVRDHVRVLTSKLFRREDVIRLAFRARLPNVPEGVPS